MLFFKMNYRELCIKNLMNRIILLFSSADLGVIFVEWHVKNGLSYIARCLRECE